MDKQRAHQILLAKKAAVEEFPFGPDVAVFKVAGKMFATLADNHDRDSNPAYRACARINLKCDPQEALMLRDVFDAVLPGYHMNKKHWNTVLLDGSVPVPEIEAMMDDSFWLVVAGMKKDDREALRTLYGGKA